MSLRILYVLDRSILRHTGYIFCTMSSALALFYLFERRALWLGLRVAGRELVERERNRAASVKGWADVVYIWIAPGAAF